MKENNVNVNVEEHEEENLESVMDGQDLNVIEIKPGVEEPLVVKKENKVWNWVKKRSKAIAVGVAIVGIAAGSIVAAVVLNKEDQPEDIIDGEYEEVEDETDEDDDEE